MSEEVEEVVEEEVKPHARFNPETGEVKEFDDREVGIESGFTDLAGRMPKSHCKKCHGRGYHGKSKTPDKGRNSWVYFSCRCTRIR